MVEGMLSSTGMCQRVARLGMWRDRLFITVFLGYHLCFLEDSRSRCPCHGSCLRPYWLRMTTVLLCPLRAEHIPAGPCLL